MYSKIQGVPNYVRPPNLGSNLKSKSGKNIFFHDFMLKHDFFFKKILIYERCNFVNILILKMID